MIAAKMFAILIIMFIAFGIVGPAFISANSYILVAVGVGWIIGSVTASIWLLGQVINYFIGENNVYIFRNHWTISIINGMR